MHGTIQNLFALVALSLLCAGVSWLLTLLMMPVFRRYAVARPNARSSHKVPTPQGGGASVLAAMLLSLAFAAIAFEPTLFGWPHVALAIAALTIAATGALDDVFELGVRPRLAAQFSACALAMAAAFAGSPASLSIAVVVIALAPILMALVWFVNLSNFMDGIDGITVAEFVPIGAALALASAAGATPAANGAIAAALAGALVGFAPWNRHVAKLFLGDVGSLSIGLIAGSLLFQLVLDGQLAAALILPLYYLCDATLTLVRRWTNGENVTQAHRTHFYQRATDHGWSVPAITGLIWKVNAALASLALASIWFSSWATKMVLFAAACALVGWLLKALARSPQK